MVRCLALIITCMMSVHHDIVYNAMPGPSGWNRVYKCLQFIFLGSVSTHSDIWAAPMEFRNFDGKRGK